MLEQRKPAAVTFWGVFWEAFTLIGIVEREWLRRLILASTLVTLIGSLIWGYVVSNYATPILVGVAIVFWMLFSGALSMYDMSRKHEHRS